MCVSLMNVWTPLNQIRRMNELAWHKSGEQNHYLWCPHGPRDYRGSIWDSEWMSRTRPPAQCGAIVRGPMNMGEKCGVQCCWCEVRHDCAGCLYVPHAPVRRSTPDNFPSKRKGVPLVNASVHFLWAKTWRLRSLTQWCPIATLMRAADCDPRPYAWLKDPYGIPPVGYHTDWRQFYDLNVEVSINAPAQNAQKRSHHPEIRAMPHNLVIAT